jgi:hypothetical protein
MHEKMHINSQLAQALEVLEWDERLAAEHGRCVLGNQQYLWRRVLTQCGLALCLYTTKEPAVGLPRN